jgi:hypothetical protein
VRIIGNRMWGYRYLDNHLAGSNAHGTALITHEGGGPLNDSRGYALIKDNVIPRICSIPTRLRKTRF